jgi:hypothetical protein
LHTQPELPTNNGFGSAQQVATKTPLAHLVIADTMTALKRRFPKIVESSDSDEPAADPVTDLVGQIEVSSDTGSSDSDDPVSRKARKLVNILATASAVNPFAYAMQHGKFPDAEPVPRTHRPEPPELADSGFLWNAVPPKTCQYLDLEAVQAGSETSEGSTGSSEGSLSDADFIDKETPPDIHSAEDLQELQRLFPKTFSRENMHKHAPQCKYIFPKSDAQKDTVMVNGIIQFPIWKRGPVSSHPMNSGADKASTNTP